jgi:hypothetical protein
MGLGKMRVSLHFDEASGRIKFVWRYESITVFPTPVPSSPLGKLAA